MPSASMSLGGGATVSAGVNSENSAYAGVSLSFLIQTGFNEFKGHHFGALFL